MLCFVVVVVPPNLSLPNLSVFVVVVVVVVVMTVVVFFFSPLVLMDMLEKEGWMLCAHIICNARHRAAY